MRTSSGWLLLLACALVQVVARRAGTRAAIGMTVLASAGYLALAYLTREATALPVAGMLACFWVACTAIVLAQREGAREREELTALSSVDEATGCLNRRGFTLRLEQAVAGAAGTGRTLSLLALDLDHFKQVNDRFGHLSGDAVLIEVVARLTDTVGLQGVVARLGGEEFAVLLPDADAEGAGVMAERILGTIRGLRFQSLPPDVQLTMSAGISAEPVHDERTAGALRARADEALYAAKRTGRDRALLWAPGVRSHATPASTGRTIGGSQGRLVRVL